MKKTLSAIFIMTFCCVNMLWAQDVAKEEKTFSVVVDIPTTSVKNHKLREIRHYIETVILKPSKIHCAHLTRCN